MALLGFFLPPCAASGIQTNVSSVVPTHELLKDALPTELPCQSKPGQFWNTLGCERAIIFALLLGLSFKALTLRLCYEVSLAESGLFASHPGAPGSIIGVSENFSLDVAEIY